MVDYSDAPASLGSSCLSLSYLPEPTAIKSNNDNDDDSDVVAQGGRQLPQILVRWKIFFLSLTFLEKASTGRGFSPWDSENLAGLSTEQSKVVAERILKRNFYMQTDTL